MPSTPLFGFPYPPETGAAPDVPLYMQNLAQALETNLTRYSRTMSFSRSVADSTPVQITAPTTVVEKNRPTINPFTTGQFTAWQPMLVAVMLAAVGVLSATRTTARIQLNGSQIVAADSSNGAQGTATATLVWWLTTGDTIDYWVYQNSGGSVTMTGFASIVQIG